MNTFSLQFCWSIIHAPYNFPSETAHFIIFWDSRQSSAPITTVHFRRFSSLQKDTPHPLAIIPDPHLKPLVLSKRVDRAGGPSLLFLISGTIQKVLWERISSGKSPRIYICLGVKSLECLSDPQAQRLANQERKGEAIPIQSSQANESGPVSQSKRNVSVCLRSYPEGSSGLGHTRQRCGLFPSWTPRRCQVTPYTSPVSPNSSVGKTEHSLHGKLAMLVEPIYTLSVKKKKKPPYLSGEEKGKGTPS